jgi:DnaJ family protein C protein 28
MSKVEEEIRRAMQEGKFDNLPGMGKPIHLQDDPFEDPEWRMAYHVLRSSGYTLPWIEARRTLEADLEQARLALKRTWEWRQTALEESQPPRFVLAVWDQAVHLFRQRIEKYNQDIQSYNLQAPHTRFHLPRLSVESELGKVTASGDCPVNGWF